MPRRTKGPRLALKRYASGEQYWTIRDGSRQLGTGCSQERIAEAEQALAAYIAQKHIPTASGRQASRLLIADVMTVYLTEHAPHVANTSFVRATAEPIIEWWGSKAVTEIRSSACREYVAWRMQRPHKRATRNPKGVSEATARHDLKTLRAALRYYHAEYGPLDTLPTVTLPEPPPAADRWLTRSEAARLLWRARRERHLARFLLIGLHSGTRSDAICHLGWEASPSHGWVDVKAGLIYRRGSAERETKKRRPTCAIHERLVPFLARWQEMDVGRSAWVIHRRGLRVADVWTSFVTARTRAGLGPDVTPHTLRHTFVTWALRAGKPPWDVARYVGMSLDTLDRVYGHHIPERGQATARR